jgi:uncharacterized repeat protein (TIGR04138 family)
MPKDFDEALEAVLQRDPRYPREAYHFVREALEHAQQAANRASGGETRHISGQELLAGIREFALRQFGPMACCVLDDWGVKRCEDFGEIVFNLIDQRILSKTEQDSRDDFKGGYDFTEAFRRPFEPTLKSNRGCQN